MNVLVLNPVHPSTPHISAVRAFRFSAELRKLGHRVLLVTGPRSSERGIPVAPDASTTPDILEVGKQTTAPRHSQAVRRLLTVAHLVQDGGWNYSWSRAVALAFPRLTDFRPDVIWVSFGKMEAVVAARRLARTLEVPWVLDIKDNWELYVPKGLRSLMVRRTWGWSALTANSQFFARMSSKWQGSRAQVVYSGVDESFLRPKAPTLPDGKLVVSIVGGLYFHQPLEALLEGLSRWQSRRAIPVEVSYVGADTEKMLHAARLVPDVQVQSSGYLPISALADRCSHSHLNAYISHPGTFHHKLLELVSAGRPVLACPSHDDESRQLVRTVGGMLLVASTPEEVVASLDLARGAGQLELKSMEAFTWARQAMVLEKVLTEVTTRWK